MDFVMKQALGGKLLQLKMHWSWRDFLCLLWKFTSKYTYADVLVSLSVCGLSFVHVDNKGGIT